MTVGSEPRRNNRIASISRWQQCSHIPRCCLTRARASLVSRSPRANNWTSLSLICPRSPAVRTYRSRIRMPTLNREPTCLQCRTSPRMIDPGSATSTLVPMARLVGSSRRIPDREMLRTSPDKRVNGAVNTMSSANSFVGKRVSARSRRLSTAKESASDVPISFTQNLECVSRQCCNTIRFRRLCKVRQSVDRN